MSGPRPQHLSRRGAVYLVRFTLPKDLQRRFGIVEVRKSLHTKSIDVARTRCLDAENWFQDLIRCARQMANLTRNDIERAAALYFSRLQTAIDQPRIWPDAVLESQISFNIEESQERIGALELQLMTNKFDGRVADHVAEMLRELNATLASLDLQLGSYANLLAAKTEREQHRYFIHQLTNPAGAYQADDGLFQQLSGSTSPSTPIAVAPSVQLSAIGDDSYTVGMLVDWYTPTPNGGRWHASNVSLLLRRLGL